MSENKEYVVTKEKMGKIHISEDVIAAIAAAAALEVEGVSGLSSSMDSDSGRRLSSKNLKKGVRINTSGSALRIDVAIFVTYGYTIPEVAEKVQTAVRTAVENSTAQTLGPVNVHVGGVSLEKPAKS